MRIGANRHEAPERGEVMADCVAEKVFSYRLTVGQGSCPDIQFHSLVYFVVFYRAFGADA